MNTDNKINDNLKDVIERNYDAYRGYEKAAEKVNNPQLAGTFRDQAQQRKRFALELAAETNILGADTKEQMESGTFEGKLHRTWMDVKTALSFDKDEAVLEECLRGEKDSLEEYDELIKSTNLSGQPQNLITRQRNTIKNCINDLQRLENAID
ncbi:MAG: hypothetical protein DHS20C17_28390 [Cyclobacteriaceae bacterium]|nr:MAG: hypothetical protein DHS20C17_28390 [Cyclobacteriaceae bacterium]